MQEENEETRPARPARPDLSAQTAQRPILSGVGRRAPGTTSGQDWQRRLVWRRTLIPILLTLGVLFVGLGAAQWVIDADYPFSAQNLMWVAVLLPSVGIMLLTLAVMNMRYVGKMGTK